MAVTPIINFPTSQPGFSTNLQNQTLKGTSDPSTKSILVNGATGGVSYVSGATGWVFTTLLNEGNNNFQVMALDGAGGYSAPDTINISYNPNTALNLVLTPPTGITLERFKNSVKISVIQNPEYQVIGYNFYGSEEVGGGTQGFTLLNSELIIEPDYYKENSIVLSETVDASGNIRTTTTKEQVYKDYYFAYTHDRTQQPLGNKPISEANHYVVTAVAFDTVLQQQVESIYSSELGATPLLLDTNIKDIPLRITDDIQQSFINEMLVVDPTVDVKPGTATRDLYINPPSDEFARLYIIQDFFHASQSFLTLMLFDDANGDGVSDPITTGSKKERLQLALYIPDERASDVQKIIDTAFTKLAGNVNVKRKEAQNAIGQALFYTKKTPTRDVSINSGAVIETISDVDTPAVQFKVLTDFTLALADLDNYYNKVTQRYEVRLDIQAIESGEQGNVDAEKITVIVSNVDSIFGVTNPSATEFGQDIESNDSLAQRAMLSFVSVDSGTEGGYLATTLGTPNVQRARIISAGEELMQRDIDPLRLVHTYGKVDIYIQGSMQTSYTENFGFTYATVKKDTTLITNASNFEFLINNPDISPEKPIYELIEVKNLTKSANYDTTGWIIGQDGNAFRLDKTLSTNQSIGLSPTDTIQTSYRYRDSVPYTFIKQPVDTIVSVIGETSGQLTSQNYKLQKLEDPLKFGNSTSANDQMSIIYANGIPDGSIIPTIDEAHTLSGEINEELSRYGIDADTIVITNELNTVTYVKDIDYVITPGSSSTLTTIKRTPASTIPDGNKVLVSYNSGETLSVTYYINTLLLDVQDRINVMRHLTADVVVKGAILTYIDFDIKIILDEGTDQNNVDRQIRTAISKHLSDKQIGSSIFQSDVVNVIENISGVNHTVIPFTKMVKADGSQVIREAYTGGWEIYQTNVVTSYKSIGTLSWETIDGGGPETNFRGVFENDIELNLVTSASKVAEEKGRAYIGGDGHIYVSPKLGNIDNANITVTYIVMGSTGARDIYFSEIEYGRIGNLVISFDFISKFKGF